MARWLAVVAVVAGCATSGAVECADGTTCPAGTECRTLTNPDEQMCATREEVAACTGKQAFDDCTLSDVTAARCYDGVCLGGGCGNGRVDPEEICDDHNATPGDGCAAGCMSDETCGNGVIDLVGDETCDDTNHLDHDGCTSACQSELLVWRAKTFSALDGGAAYDARRDRVVTFDGPFAGTGTASEFDGSTWTQFRGTTPPGRARATMAFDGHNVVLYAGEGTSDTWVFDGTEWRPVFGPSPGFRQHHTMAYDSKRDRVVMFGGYNSDNGNDQTWEWNGATESWAQIVTSPPPKRIDAMMAYDPIRGVVVLAGGRDATTMATLGDTWTFDGATWHDATPSSGTVPALAEGVMAFDSGSGRVIAYGPYSTDPITSPRPAYTLAWNGSVWTDLALATMPEVRLSPPFASMGSRIVLSGGRDGEVSASGSYAGTWIFEAGAWTRAPSPGPRSTIAINDYARTQLLALGGQDSTGASTNETWLLDGRGWRKTAVGTTPTGSQIAYDWAANEVVLHDQSTATTWTWNGTVWTSHVLSVFPPNNGTSMAFDGTHLTSIGGVRSGLGPTSETWSWTGTAWVKATPAHSPPPNRRSIVGYDPIRKQLVRFGGEPNLDDQTWTYDGTDWTKHDVAVRPPPSSGSGSPQFAWNPARQCLVLAIGINSIWEWDGTSWTPQATSELPPRMGSPNFVTALDGGGIELYGSQLTNISTGYPSTEELWELRFAGPGLGDRCEGSDLDADGLAACEDPDCWMTCTPACAPGVCP